MGGIIYREAKEGDLDKIVEMWKELRREQDHWNADYRVYSDNCVELTKEYFEEKLVSNDSFLVAEENLELVGFALAEVKDFSPPIYSWKKDGQIRNIFVKNNSRGKGIGKELMNQVMNFLSNKVDIISVKTNINTENAISFYESFGLDKFQVGLYKVVKK